MGRGGVRCLAHLDGPGTTCSLATSPAWVQGDPRSKARAAAAAAACSAGQPPPAPAAAAAAAGPAIDRRRASELSYSDFVRQYMDPNLPVLLEASGAWVGEQVFALHSPASLI